MIKNPWSYVGTRFVAVGIFNTLLDFALLNLLVFVFSLNNIAANTISVSIAMLVSYVLNHRIVFRQNSENHFKKLILFLVITAFGLWILQNATVYIFIHWLTWPAQIIKNILEFIGLGSITRDFVILNTAKAIGSAVSMTWNFFLYRRFVFIDRSKTVTY